MNVPARTISEDVLTILAASELDGSKLVIAGGQLDRKMYVRVNEIIEAAGGKWSRKDKAHLFDGEAAEAIEPILLTGEIIKPQDFGQFDTPTELAERVVNTADVRPGMAVLEPSAGLGNIASAVRQFGAFVTCWELDPKRAEKLKDIAHSLNVGDFLSATPTPVFDRVAMNPPFARQDDIRHVMHATKFLKPGGHLASVMSASVMFRDNRLTTEFRAFVSARGGTIERLPEGSFRESGTLVNTCLVSFAA